MDVALGGLAFVIGRIERGADVVMDERTQQDGAFIDRRAERGFRIIDPAGHVRVLRTLAREEEGDFRRGGRSDGGFCFLAQFGDRVAACPWRQSRGGGESAASGGERVGHVGERRVFRFEMIGETARHRIERGFAERADRTSSSLAAAGWCSGAGGASSMTTWALVPPTPKALTPAMRGVVAGFPIEIGGDRVERAVSEIDARVGCLEMEQGGDFPVAELLDRLDQVR